MGVNVEEKDLPDGPTVQETKEGFIVVGHNGDVYRWGYARAQLVMLEPPPKARSINPVGRETPRFELIRPGKETRVNGGTFVEDDEVLFSTPDPGNELLQDWTETIG